ncbi:MAG: hypothetical protein Kow0088_01680 [Anaerolineales bacterium]
MENIAQLTTKIGRGSPIPNGYAQCIAKSELGKRETERHDQPLSFAELTYLSASACAAAA